ncbi:hypothetical protein [Collimonas antrihumi]|uniref:hypothetical protein n=1 Tax=Collimonas antrihumi TaxID=1940615 RepID=UPI001B8B92AD|nr:hypothetical protein [Collimonas antrihumi]
MAQSIQYDMNGAVYPGALCNEKLFSSGITDAPDFQAFEQSILKDPLLPTWARNKPMNWACNLKESLIK